MNTHLEDAVATVAKERGGKFDGAFGAASRLVAEFGESGLAERIASQIPNSVPCEVVSDLLGLLVWSTQDNGEAIHNQVEKWLTDGTDLRKIQIALGLESYPFKSATQMAEVLMRVAETHPQVAAHCVQLIKQRQAEGGA